MLPTKPSIRVALLGACLGLPASGMAWVEFDAPPGLKALGSEPMNSGDVEIRIHLMGSFFLESKWLTLRRKNGKTSITYTFDPLNGKPPRARELTPRISADRIWSYLENHGIYDLSGDPAEDSCTEQPMSDAETISVEVRRATQYRHFAYYDVEHSQCAGADQLIIVLRFLQQAVGSHYSIL